MTLQARRVYQFGQFQLDIQEYMLLRDGKVVPLTRKAFETLSLLVQNSGIVLQKDEMMKSIWPNSFVEEATLAQNVFTLRRILGESPNQAQYIETVPGRGYRFIAKVSEVLLDDHDDTASERGNGAGPLKSIAILPFKVLTSDTNDEYFGLGLADALITRLSNVKDIVVRPTSAILKYHRQEQELSLIGRELKVQLLLAGIIQQLDERIRITVQLVDVETGVPLWADKFDEEFSDVFSLQDAISERAMEALTLKLTKSERQLLTKHHAKNSVAYRCYLKGRYLWSKWTEDGFNKSIAFFERAIEIEPTFAMAYAGLADTYTSLAFNGYVVPHQAMPKVKAMSRKALHLDEEMAEARLPLAASLFFYDWDWEGAEVEFKRSIKANPNYAIAQQMYSLFLVAMKRFDEAKAMMRQALESDPVSPLIKTTAGFPYFYSGQYDQAIKQYRDTLEEDPYFGLAHVALANAYTHKGMYDEAIYHYKQAMATWGEKLGSPHLGYAYAVSNRRSEAIDILKKLERLSTKEYISPLSMATVYAGLEERDETFRWLEKAYEERSNKLVFLAVKPSFKKLRSDPQFKDLLRRIGLET